MAENFEVISQDDEEDNLPTREICQKLVEEFASITNTDEALAQFFLQDRDWNLERSVNAFFEAQNSSGVNVLTDGKESEVIVTFDSAMTSALSKLPGTVTTRPPDKFSLMSWNLDGLDTHNLKKRTKAVAKVIEIEGPDIIFLQEVIPATYSYLEDQLPGYMFLSGGTEDYFIATLLNRTTVYFDGHTLHTFPNSVMGRNFLLVNCHIGSLKLRLINTHLESTKNFAEARKIQLKMCLDYLTSCSQEYTSIFGGDLNLRDDEVSAVGLPSEVSDMWESCGKRSECEFTWDTRRNTNKSFPGKFKPRARFDRVYLHNSKPPSVKDVHFGLCGIQKVSGTQSFPSDHWGIIIRYDILNQSARTSSPPPSYAIPKYKINNSSDSLTSNSDTSQPNNLASNSTSSIVTSNLDEVKIEDNFTIDKVENQSEVEDISDDSIVSLPQGTKRKKSVDIIELD